MPTCPSCSHTWGSTRAVKAIVPVDIATMTDAQLFAHYKKTSLLGDVIFWQRTQMSDALRDRFESLESDIVHGFPRAESLRQLHALQDAWRRERPWTPDWTFESEPVSVAA